MELAAPNHRRRIRLSLPGLSLVILVMFMGAVFWLVVVCLSPHSPLTRGAAVLAAVVGLGLRFKVVSLATMGPLLVISDGARDSYVAADDLVSVALGRSLGPVTLLKVSHKKRQFGFATTICVRTLVWRSEATTVLQRIHDLFGRAR